MTKVLVVSTYELGNQPLGAAYPAAALEAAGHEVQMLDLSVDDVDVATLGWCEKVVCSVPMHTALRLALAAVAHWRATRPYLPVCYLGLYAPVALESGALAPGDGAMVEAGEALVEWADAARADQDGGARDDRFVALSRPSRASEGAGLLPRRDGLPPLGRYAKMIDGSGDHLVASIEASRGCNHRCRHCPVPIVYEGRSQPVGLDLVAADLDRVVALGATHVRFSDPDFLNRPEHARRVARMLHDHHEGLSFDATIKVSHLLRHRDLLGELAEAGLAFVVSAFESTSDTVLEALDKGHRGADLGEAVELLRAHGVEVRPSLLPFTPWTTRDDLCALFDFVAAYDLVANVDPIQYSIRLLLPPRSLLLTRPDPVLSTCIVGYEQGALGYVWRSPDPVLDDLQGALAERVEGAADLGEGVEDTYRALRALVYGACGRTDRGIPAAVSSGPPEATRPRLTEAWFCCAEPSASQLSGMSATA